MPRKARLDIPGLLQHVIARGIERRKIFRDDNDRSLFLQRLSALLVETDTECLAWALIPNHFHLLLRPNRCTLKDFMRRLLTGYAINFNHRHKRSGHVFQNRYKSIVCDEENYLLELIRYIHLNPLRARVLKDRQGLDNYLWSGHSVILGNNEMVGQSIDEVLARFGKNRRQARQRYSEFVSDGIALGKRNELTGGGLRRSVGDIAKLDSNEIEFFDERVLGCSEFVEQLRQKVELRENMASAIMLPELFARVSRLQHVEPEKMKHYSIDPQVKLARDIFCYIAVRILKHSGTDTGRLLNIKRAAVCHAVKRGEKIATEQASLIDAILAMD